MGILSRVKIRPLGEDIPYHEVTVDGIPVRAKAVDVSFRVDELPETHIELMAQPDLEFNGDVHFRYDPETIEECIKMLGLELQLDESLYEAFTGSIYSALTECLPDSDEDFKKGVSKYILDRLIGDA